MVSSLTSRVQKLAAQRRPPAVWTDAERRAIEAAESSLHAFVRQAWSVLEPATPFIDSWHLHAICEHLEAISYGELRRLVINIPPRHMKSLLVSVFWPAWEWIAKPHLRYLTSSYAAPLAIRDALKTRRLITSPWYRARWGDRFVLTGDQNMKSRYENDRTGYRIATSVGGEGTGEGGDRIVVDDPHKTQEAESDVVRAGVIDWWDGTMSTRVNDPKTAAYVIVMQRVHEQDLTGHVLVQGGYEHLCLPARYEASRRVVTALAPAAQDPRRGEGELLCPARFGAAELADLELRLGPYQAAGQLQQRPSPAEGGMFKRAWWQTYDPRDLEREPGDPARLRVVQIAHYVDSAFKTGTASDYSVCATWGTDGRGSYYLLDLWRERVEFPDLLLRLHRQHARWESSSPLVIEDKASGQSAIQALRRPLPLLDGQVLPALPVIAWKVSAGASKESRAEGVTGLVAGGRVYLPAGVAWVDGWIEEHAQFPNGAHDDQVDTTTMALERLGRPVQRDIEVWPNPLAKSGAGPYGIRLGVRPDRERRSSSTPWGMSPRRPVQVPGMGRWGSGQR